MQIPFLISLIVAGLETLANLGTNALRQRLPVWIFLSLGCNLAIAPAVLATSNGTIDRSTAYAIGLLGIVTLGLAIYLFAVIFQPERF
jgi:K+-transporting ATPase KdpF subunit